MVYPLHELGPQETAEIVWVISESPMSFKLKSLGFVPREHVTCVIKGHRGCMSAYRVRGLVIALRSQNAKEVLVRPLEQHFHP